jgi:hypothetical protein
MNPTTSINPMNSTNPKTRFGRYILALLILWIPSMVVADVGDIFSRFQPYITAQEEYTDNLYLTSKNKKSDFFTSIVPGLRFSTLPRSETTGEFRPASSSIDTKYGVDLDFNVPLVYYGKESQNNYVGLAGTLNAWYSFDPRLTFRVRNYSIRSEEPREQDYSATALPGQFLLSTERGTRPIYFRNVFSPSFAYRFGRDDLFSIYYENNIYRNQSSLFEDSAENFINPKLTYWFNIRNGVSLGYGFTLGDFQSSPDLLGHMAMVRYTYRFDPKMSIFSEYTQLWRDFDFPSVDYLVYKPSIGIERAFSQTLSGRAQFGYFWENPEKSSTTSGFSYDISLTQRAERTTYTASLQGGYTEDYFTAQNLGFTEHHRAMGTITHRFLQRMSVGLFGSYEWAKYPGSVIEDKKAKDQIWAVGGDASYQILRWLTVSLDTSYRENHSNISERDYSEYRGMFKVTATY